MSIDSVLKVFQFNGYIVDAWDQLDNFEHEFRYETIKEVMDLEPIWPKLPTVEEFVDIFHRVQDDYQVSSIHDIDGELLFDDSTRVDKLKSEYREPEYDNYYDDDYFDTRDSEDADRFNADVRGDGAEGSLS